MKIWLVLFLALMASGCGQSAPKLPAAHNKIPVYPNATYKESMGGTTSDLGSGQALTESLSWWLTFTDAADKVVAFYEKELPRAKRGPDPDDRDVVRRFQYVPQGAESGESVTIIVRKNEIQITEVLKAGKRRK